MHQKTLCTCTADKPCILDMPKVKSGKSGKSGGGVKKPTKAKGSKSKDGGELNRNWKSPFKSEVKLVNYNIFLCTVQYKGGRI